MSRKVRPLFSEEGAAVARLRRLLGLVEQAASERTVPLVPLDPPRIPVAGPTFAEMYAVVHERQRDRGEQIVRGVREREERRRAKLAKAPTPIRSGRP